MSFHNKLKQYRVVYTIVTIFFLYLGWDAWDWFKEFHNEMDSDAAAGFAAIFLAIIGSIKYALENSRQDNDQD